MATQTGQTSHRQSLDTQGQIVGTGRRFTGKTGARAKVYKTHVSAPGLLHVSREFQKTPEKFEVPASGWPEKMFSWPISEEHLS